MKVKSMPYLLRCMIQYFHGACCTTHWALNIISPLEQCQSSMLGNSGLIVVYVRTVYDYESIVIQYWQLNITITIIKCLVPSGYGDIRSLLSSGYWFAWQSVAVMPKCRFYDITKLAKVKLPAYTIYSICAPGSLTLVHRQTYMMTTLFGRLQEGRCKHFSKAWVLFIHAHRWFLSEYSI